MTAPDAIPDGAKLALRQGNKIEAIKLVREARGCDLKSAKDAVEAYVASDPVIRAEMQSVVKRGNPRAWLWVVGFIALIAAGYLLSHD